MSLTQLVVWWSFTAQSATARPSFFHAKTTGGTQAGPNQSPLLSEIVLVAEHICHVCVCAFFCAASLRNTDGSSPHAALLLISHVDEPQRAKGSMESALRVRILTFSPISAFSPSFFFSSPSIFLSTYQSVSLLASPLITASLSLFNCLVCHGVQAHIMPLLLARRQVHRSRRRRQTTLDPRLGRQDGNSAV